MYRFKVILITLFTLTFSGCGQEPSATLRLGTSLWPGYEPLYLARDLENWQPEKIRLVDYPSASDVLRAFRNQAIEAASLTLDEVLQLRELDIPKTVVLVHDISAGADVIIAKPDIKGIQDLRGKRVAVEGAAVGAYVITRALEKNGLSIDDIEIKNINVNMHEKAFMENEVDAVVTFEPTRTRLLSTGAREIFSSRDIPNEIVDVLVVNKKFLEKNPLVVKELIDGWFRALAYMQTNEVDAAARLSQRLKISPEEVIASYEGLILPDRSLNYKLLGGENPELNKTIENLNRILVKNAILKGIVDIEDLFSYEFIR